VRPIFPEVVVARDFDHFQITRERIELRYEELAEDDTLLPESAATGNVA